MITIDDKHFADTGKAATTRDSGHPPPGIPLEGGTHHRANIIFLYGPFVDLHHLASVCPLSLYLFPFRLTESVYPCFYLFALRSANQAAESSSSFRFTFTPVAAGTSRRTAPPRVAWRRRNSHIFLCASLEPAIPPIGKGGRPTYRSPTRKLLGRPLPPASNIYLSPGRRGRVATRVRLPGAPNPRRLEGDDHATGPGPVAR